MFKSFKKIILILIISLTICAFPLITNATEVEEEQTVNNELQTTEKHSVTYVLNGGTCEEGECIDGEVDDGTVLTKPQNPTKDDHNFINWYSDQDLNNEYNFSDPVNDNLTLYAKFEFVERVEITASTTKVEFGTVSINFKENIDKTVTIKNTGNVNVTLTLGDVSTEYCLKLVDFENNKVLAPNEEYIVTVRAEKGSNTSEVQNVSLDYVFTATSESTASSSVTVKASISLEMPDIKITYATHVQKVGWQTYKSNGITSGTTGQALRLEAIKIKLENSPYDGSVEYKTHIQKIGWENGFRRDDAISGTSGRALRLEAIEIKLTGEIATHYDIYYRVHAQHYGWLGWARNGEQSGTAGYAYRLEAIEVKLVDKGTNFDGYGNEATFHDASNGSVIPNTESKLVAYKTHVQKVGWQDYVYDGAMSGTEGKAYRLEGIKIKLSNQKYTGDIEYKTHVQSIGWESSYKKNDEMSGTEGKALRLEAIRIRLTDEMAEHYDVYYRVHVQKLGWLGWARNGDSAGTEGYAFRLEGIEIKLIAKGETFSEYGKKVTYYNISTGSIMPDSDEIIEGGWQVIDGKTYYIHPDGSKAKYLTKIGGIRYEFSKDGELQHSNVKVIADLSAHNAEHGPINFDAMWDSGEIDGLIFRLSYSIGLDRQVQSYVSNAKRLGIPYSVYIFSNAENAYEAGVEAKFVVDKYKQLDLNTSMEVFYDLEGWYNPGSGHSSAGITPAMYDTIIETFKNYLNQNGLNMSVYASTNYANTKLGAYGRSQLGWIAQYASRCTYTGSYRGWQYTSTGKLTGVNGNVDLSVFYY